LHVVNYLWEEAGFLHEQSVNPFVIVCTASNFGQIVRCSWNFLWTSYHWRSRHVFVIFNFLPPII